MTYRLARQVERDLLGIFDYIAKDSRPRAQRLIERFYQEFAGIAERPTLFQLQPHLRSDLRRARVGRYLVLFRIRRDDVLIERVLHGSRDIPTTLRFTKP